MTSEFACFQVVELDTSPGSMSPGNILQGSCHFCCIIVPLTERFPVQKIMAQIPNSLFFWRPQYTPVLAGWQDCKLLPAFPHHSHRLPGPFQGQKLKALLLKGKIQEVAKAKGKSVLIVLFSHCWHKEELTQLQVTHERMTQSARKELNKLFITAILTFQILKMLVFRDHTQRLSIIFSYFQGRWLLD